MTAEQQIAEFLARKGATKIAAGERALNYNRRDWQAAVRGETPPSVERQQRREQEERERITIVTDHAGREFYRNAEGEWL